jgi:hypothetical protein
MKYFVIIWASLAFAAVSSFVNWSFEQGEKQGYAKGYNDGKQVEPNTAQCIGFWFGGKVPANRMNELRNFCKEMK